MQQRSLNAFGGAGSGELDRHVRLAIVRSLARLYSHVLHEPLPKSLERLLEQLDERRG